jgi:tRNA U34 2-thiouridine synthase MnmA/TrmU
MAKLSVNGVEVIRDDGQVDWGRLSGVPGYLIGVNTSNRLNGSQSQKFFMYDLENDGTGRLRLVQSTFNCDALGVNCACACQCGGD